MALFVDPSKEILQTAFAEAEAAEVDSRLERDLIDQIELGLARRGRMIPEAHLEAVDAQGLLTDYRLSAELRLESLANESAGIDWLWHLRRLPELFVFNDLRSTAPYCREIAEIAASLSTVTPASAQPIRGLDGGRIPQLQTLRTLVGIIYELHSAIRWAGKGAPIKFRSGSTPDWKADEELERAVRLYDRRHSDIPPGATAGAGLGASAALAPLPTTGEGTIVPILFELGKPTRFPLPYDLEGSIDEIDGSYVIGAFDLAQIKPLFASGIDHNDIWSTAFPSAVALLLTYFSPYFIGTATMKSPSTAAVLNVHSVGYEVSLRANVALRLDWILERVGELSMPIPRSAWPENSDAALERLSAEAGTLWPPRRGRAVLPAGDEAIVVDWWALTRLFFQLIRRIEGGGPTVNMWAAGFEEEIQGLLDDGPWKPPPRLRGLRRRTLRLNGKDLTDIDAIGHRDRTTLLVSCKSFALNDAYDRGDYAVVRNRRTEAEAAVKRWAEIVDLLSTNPVGDNYKFEPDAKIVGVVVCPFLPFLSESVMMQESLPGLPTICTRHELEKSVS